MGIPFCQCGERLSENNHDRVLLAIGKNELYRNPEKPLSACNDVFNLEIYECPECGGLLIWNRELGTFCRYKKVNDWELPEEFFEKK